MGKKEKQRQVTQGFTDSEDDDDGENKSLASTFKKGNKDGAVKRARLSETGAEPPADEPAAKRQHSRQGSHDEQRQQPQEASDAVHAPSQVEASYQQSPGVEATGQPEADAPEAAAPEHHDTPFATAAAMDDPGDSTAAAEGEVAAEASNDVAAAGAGGAPAVAAAARPGKGRSRTGPKPLPASQPSRSRRQLSRLESLDTAAAAKQPSSKPARQSKKAPKKVPEEDEPPKITEEQATAYTQRVWEGFHGAGSEAAGFGDGRRGTQGCPPCERFEQPSGQDLVGWGFWEFYEDTAEDSDEEEQEGDGTWFRFAVYAYEPHSSEGPYLVVAEDGEVGRRQQSDVDGEQGTIIFCIPAHTTPAATPQHEDEQQQQQQPTESHSEIAAAAAAAAFPGAGTPTSKGKGKRKAAAQPAQQRAKQGNASQQQQQQQHDEAAAAEQQQEQHAAVEDHSEDMPPAAAEAEGAAEADAEGAAAAPQSQASAGSKKQQQQKAPRKQPQAARQRKSTLAAASGGAGDGEGGAEQQQDPAAKLQACLQRLHDAASLLRTSLQQQQEVLQDIAALGLTPQAARKYAAKAAASSSTCREVLGMIRAPGQPGKQQQYSSMLPGCSVLLQEVRKLGTSKVLPLFCDVKAAAASQQQQRRQQQQQRPQQQQQGTARPAAQQQQQQQQRQRPPGAAGKALPAHSKQQQDRRSSGGGVGGQQGSSSHDQQQNGKVPASGDDLRVFLRTCADLVPLKPLHSQPRDKTVALLCAVLQPPQAVSPFGLAQELEALLHAKYGSSQQQQQQGAKAPSQAYMRHLQVLWDMLGGADLQEADMAEKAAQEAAGEAAAAVAAAEAEGAADDETLQQARAEAEARAGAAAADAARAQDVFEGVSGEAGGASLRRALLEGRLSAKELFDATMPRASTSSKPSM